MDIKEFIDEIAGRYTFYGDRVYILPDEAPDKIGMLIVPDEAKGRLPTLGTVVAIGSGIDLDEEHIYMRGLVIGDRVVFNKFSMTVIALTRPDGTTVDVLVVHVNNLYVGWKE